MLTALDDAIRDTPRGREANTVLRTCVHCGMCNATCPTYQLLGDELDGPRGRIYLIKQMLEGADVSRSTLTHLDRCLTCRNCETTCPSGVQYHKLLNIGRDIAEQKITRPWRDRLMRWALCAVIPYRARFTPLLRLGQLLRPLLPAARRRAIPPYQRARAWPEPRHARRMLVLEGCVQPAITPAINAAAARVLDRLAISLIRAPDSGCCGAASFHTSDTGAALAFARRNIDAWWPHIEASCEAIVTTASGCGVHIKDYGDLLKNDPAYADKAARVSALTKDIGEIVAAEDQSLLRRTINSDKAIAFHSPCTLQHGQKIAGLVESVLGNAGYRLTTVPNAHLCCGSAGTYSILQSEISARLRAAKLQALESGGPELIVTANIGCQEQLRAGAGIPVCHWIELLAGD